ncbi:hypothetical protein MFLAVUS_002396 [Mucor flavus]|uniref:Uncharacterized protein n=1 Tax=Mucor flavus TaxID=439312 RepID=A0ABP9YQ72_9FUNG
MFNKTYLIALFFFAFVATLASAGAINPKINVPNSGTKWSAGQTVTIQWDVTYFDGTGTVPIPEAAIGTLKLGYLEDGDEYNEHLFWDLDTGFKLASGARSITLPADLETKTSYIIVLMGNSGNASAKFYIRAAK